MAKILVVEDDMALCMGFEYALKKEGFEVVCAKNLKEAKIAIKDKDIDLLLLDVILPDGNGYDFCRAVRKSSDIPVIFITACDEEMNIVLGLDIGGDDYITKPVRMQELVSRINAVFRRHKRASASQKESSKRLKTGDIIIEPLKCRITKDGQEVICTSIEYKLLLLLIENKGNVLSRNSILEKLWDIEGNFVGGNTLNVYINRLREKIEEDAKEPRYIETVRGLGYRWKEEVMFVE